MVPQKRNEFVPKHDLFSFLWLFSSLLPMSHGYAGRIKGVHKMHLYIFLPYELLEKSVRYDQSPVWQK